MRKLNALNALAALAAILVLGGCDKENYFDAAYEGARKAAGVAKESSGEVISDASAGIGELAEKFGIKSPDEVLQEASDLLKGPQKRAEGSNRGETGSSGESEPERPNDDSWGGNSADRGVYDLAFGENAEKGSLVEVELCRAVDGDTVVTCLDGSYSYIRLIGINTPESVAPDEYLEKTGKENTQEGKDASAHAKEVISGIDHCWLEFDQEEYDPYGRILAYVWLSQDRTELMNMLNARMIADGYAEPMTIRPNTRHAEELAALFDDGR